MKQLFYLIEDLNWNIRCRYNYWLHGPYGLSKVIEKIPFKFLIKYLRKYGANIGKECRFERGLNIHRPMGDKPFSNLIIGNNVYLGHNTLVDLSRRVTIKDKVIIASRCQIWTHASFYDESEEEEVKYGENYGDVTIERCSIIYSNVVIVHDVTIGKYSMIGANSLVNKPIPNQQFWGGVPVKFIMSVEN
jgi:acetyltransferase-like isoleucine patch superfamily enzyme